MTYKSSGQYTPEVRGLNDRLSAIEIELSRIQSTPLGRLTEVYSEPEKPRAGHYVFADGATWNPGSGRGIYIYSGSAWVQWVAL